MTEQAVTYQQVTVSEAAAILGVSVMTVRRMIRRGQLEGERVHRPQGSAYVVKLPMDATVPADDAPPTEQPAQNVSRTNGTPSELMAVWSETFLGPIMVRMAEQEGTIREQAETIGRQSAELERAASIAVKLSDELDAARAQISTLTASTAPQTVEPSQGPSGRWWRPVAPWLLLAAILLLAFAVGQPAWVR